MALASLRKRLCGFVFAHDLSLFSKNKVAPYRVYATPTAQKSVGVRFVCNKFKLSGVVYWATAFLFHLCLWELP